MKRTLTTAAILLLLSACFESHTPLGPPGAVALGASFVGTWRCHTPTMESNEIMTITVLPFDEQQLLVELKESTIVGDVEQSRPSDIDRYRFYPSQLEDKSRDSDTADKSRESDTADTSRDSDTADKSRDSDTADTSGPQILWNAQELGQTTWQFVRIKQADKSSLTAQIVEDNALQGETEQEKLSDLRKRVSDEAIYGDAISCKRMGNED